MSTPDPIGNDVRKLARERRLGEGAVCVLCGKDDSDALMRVGRTLLEAHHLGGEANDRSLTVVVCRNCHARLSEGQRDSGVDLRRRPERSSLERLEAVLRGLADFCALLAKGLCYWADELARTVGRLDRDFPGWRQEP
jgi:hypothetical protein